VVVEAIGIGLIVGLALTWLTTLMLRFAERRGWISENWVEIPIVALAAACFAGAQAAGGSGFIACYVGGLLLSGLRERHKGDLLRGAEHMGEALALLTWVVFGGIVVARMIDRVTWPALLYAVLSLTVIRMLPVFLCLIGTRRSAADKLFIQIESLDDRADLRVAQLADVVVAVAADALRPSEEYVARRRVVHRSTEDSQGDRSPATTERLAEGLRNSDVRRGGASVHHLSDIAVDLAYVDYVDSGLCCQIAIIKHRGCLPVFIRGTKQVGAPYLVDDPSARCDLGFGGDPRLRRWSSLRWRCGRRCGLLRWWRGRLRACAETAC